MKKYLKVSTVAKMLDCSKKAVYNLIYDGKLSYIRYSERNIRIPEDELETFLKNSASPDAFTKEKKAYNIVM